MMAQALADGLSLEGAGEALSIGAAGLFLRSLTGNPMDVHLHTSANLRRYLLRLDGLSMKNKLLMLLLWHTGPGGEVDPVPDGAGRRSRTWTRSPPCRIATQDELLEAITQSIYNQPPTDWSQVSNLGRCARCRKSRARSTWRQQYVNLRLRPEGVDGHVSAEIVCHDNFTEMHAFKHHQAIVEEFYATREPWRWMHLVCGAQAAAVSFGKNMEIYEEALELLHAA